VSRELNAFSPSLLLLLLSIYLVAAPHRPGPVNHPAALKAGKRGMTFSPCRGAFTDSGGDALKLKPHLPPPLPPPPLLPPLSWSRLKGNFRSGAGYDEKCRPERAFSSPPLFFYSAPLNQEQVRASTRWRSPGIKRIQSTHGKCDVLFLFPPLSLLFSLLISSF